MISNMDDPTSPLNMSGIKTHTDTTIYPPPPDATASDEPGTKKRKVSESLDVVANGSTSSVGHTAANVVGSARFTNSVHGNKRLDAVFAIVKKECEQLANSIVRDMCSCYAAQTFTWVAGPSQAMGKPLNAQVSPFTFDRFSYLLVYKDRRVCKLFYLFEMNADVKTRSGDNFGKPLRRQS